MTLPLAGCSEDWDITLKEVDTPEGLILDEDDIEIPIGLAGSGLFQNNPEGFEFDADIQASSGSTDILDVYSTGNQGQFVFMGRTAGEATVTLTVDDVEVWSGNATVTPR